MERDLSLLADIRGMAEDAIAFLGDRSLQELHQDKQLQYALIRCLEVIGEAAKQISQQTRDQYQDVPWSDYAKTRDFLIHSYAKIDSGIIWRSVRYDLPTLIENLNHTSPDAKE